MTGANVLLVDDDPMVLGALQRALRGEPWTLRATVSGNEALAMARDWTVDVLVADQRMPDMPGLELIRRHRETQLGTRCILVSGYLDDDGLGDALASGHVRAFLAKPWRRAELLAVLREAASATAHAPNH